MKATIKNKLAALALPGFAALALLGSTADSEAAAFMKLGDIKGESTDNEHKDWIIIESMSAPIFRAMQLDPATGVHRRRGDVILEDITCSKELDKASPKLAEAICTGTVFPEVIIHLCHEVPGSDGTPTQVPYLKYKLTNVLVSSYSMGGSASGDPLPTEEITLGYTEVEWTYILIDPKTGDAKGETTGSSGATVDSSTAEEGKVDASWQVEEGTK